MSKSLRLSHWNLSVGDRELVHDVSLTVPAGEIHVLMGPNGSGKSSLALTLAGSPVYSQSPTGKNSPSITLNGLDLTKFSPEERAQAGLFLSFQAPLEIPGVRLFNYLWTIYQARTLKGAEKRLTIVEFKRWTENLCASLGLPAEWLERGLNEGFSGGERKRWEIVQLLVLRPLYAVLDEIDSGLDIDALKRVAACIQTEVSDRQMGVLLITHYQKLVNLLTPQQIYVMKRGQIVAQGKLEVLAKIEQLGYDQFK